MHHRRSIIFVDSSHFMSFFLHIDHLRSWPVVRKQTFSISMPISCRSVLPTTDARILTPCVIHGLTYELGSSSAGERIRFLVGPTRGTARDGFVSHLHEGATSMRLSVSSRARTLYNVSKHVNSNMRRKRPRPCLLVDGLENRVLLSSSQIDPPAQHVLLLSVDGLHNADVSDPQLAPVLTNIQNLQNSGVTYTNAFTTTPSDSFPGTLSYLTGAGPGTTGVFYDDSYSRTLTAPGSNSSAQPGTEVQYAENIDKNSALLSGGGNFDASSIDPSKLPINPTTNQVVYPNQFLKVNTIFDVAHQAGLYTAFSDKHPAYQIAAGSDPAAINDLY